MQTSSFSNFSVHGKDRPSPPHAPRLREALTDALAEMCASAGLDVSRPVLRSTLGRLDLAACRSSADLVTALARAGREVGIVTRSTPLTGKELSFALEAGELAPLFTMASIDGVWVPLIFLGATRGRIQFRFGGSDDPASSIAVQNLSTLLGDESDAKTLYLTADPALGLEPLGDGNAPTPLSKFIALLKLERDDLGVAIVYAVAFGLLSLAMPLGVQTLVNTVAFGALLQPLVVLSLLILVGLGFAGLLRTMQSWVVERVQQRLFVRVAMDLAHRLPRVHAQAFRDAHGPELVNRFLEVVTLQKGAATLLVDGIAIVLQTVLGTLLLGFYHPSLLAFSVVVAGGILFVTFGLGGDAVQTAVKESKVKYRVLAWLEELARHPHVFRSEGGRTFAVRHAEDLARSWVEARRKHFGIVFRQIVGAMVLQTVASVALLGVGGWLVIQKELTLGQLVAAELIVTAIVSGFTKFGKYFETYYDVLASAEKLAKLVSLPLDARTGAAPLGQGPLRVELTGGADEFETAGDERTGFVELQAGEVVAVVDRSAGKSSLADAVEGLSSSRRLSVAVDGQDVSTIAPGVLFDRVMILREPEIFAKTIAENLSLDPYAPNARAMAAALDAVGLGPWLASLDKGLDTELQPLASGLPRSTAMRLMVARALMRGPGVLVVDGAFDGLDGGTVAEIVHALRQQGEGPTLLVVTRDATALQAFGRTIHLHRLRSASGEYLA